MISVTLLGAGNLATRLAFALLESSGISIRLQGRYFPCGTIWDALSSSQNATAQGFFSGALPDQGTF